MPGAVAPKPPTTTEGIPKHKNTAKLPKQAPII